MRVYYPRAFVQLKVVVDGLAKGIKVQDAKRLNIKAIPKSVQIHKNSDNQADSFSLTFDANDMPFFPGQILACEVEVYLYQVDGAETGSLISGKPSTDTRTNIGRASVDALIADAERQIKGKGIEPVVIGLVDDASLNMGSDGRWLELSGQDYTAHFQSVQWPPLANGRARKVTIGQRLDVWLNSVMREVDPSGRISLILENVAAKDLPTVGQGFTRTNKNGITIEQGTKYWDVIYKVAKMHGFSAFIDGAHVVLRATRGKDDQVQRKFFTMAWGHNVESVDSSRKLGQEAAPRVIMRAFDQKKRKVVEASWPPEGSEAAKKSTKVSSSGSKDVMPNKPGEFIIKAAPAGITDPKQLQALAREEREHIAGGEQKLLIKTRDLRDIARAGGEGNDLLGLRHGDIMALELSQIDYNGVGERKTVGERTAYLEQRGFSQDVAQFVASNFEAITRSGTVFVVREASFDYSVEDGISLEIELIKAVDPGDGSSTAQQSTKRYKRPDGTIVGVTR